MKIAYVCWTVPHPPNSGGKNRSYHLMRYLAEGHEVHLHVPSWESLDLDDGFVKLFASFNLYRFDFAQWKSQRWERRFKGLPNGVCAFYAAPALERFHAWVRAHAPDLIFVDEAVVAPYAWPHRDIPAILARQKADYRYSWDVFRHAPMGRAKLEALAESVRFRLYERRLWSRFRFGVVVSEEERRLFLGMRPGLELAIVPNGVDVARFVPRPLPTSGPPTILLNGLMSYFPNVDAATWFVKAAAPRIFDAVPDARVMIVGHDPSDAVRRLATGDRVVVTGSVPDMRPYLERSHVVVVPLRVGHGTRLKILEAFAAGRPVVSTSTGAEGLRVEPGRHLIMEDGPWAFAAGVVRLLKDRALAETMAREARLLAERSYSWDGIGASLETFCQEAAEKGRIR